MKIDIEQLKTLVEAGDTSAIEKHILESALEKGDLTAAVKANKAIESERDQQIATSLQTWKDNHLQGIVDEEVNKRNPAETPEQKRIRELEEKIAAKEQAEQRSVLKEQAFKYAADKGYDTKFATKWIEKLLGDDEATTNTTLDEFKTDLDGIVQAAVESKFKDNGRDIERGLGGDTGGALDVDAIASQANIRNK